VGATSLPSSLVRWSAAAPPLARPCVELPSKLGMVCLAWGDFVLGQPVPKDFPDRTALPYAAGAFMLVAGAAVQWRRTVAWGAAALTGYHALIVVVLMNGRVALHHYAEFGTYSGVAEQMAIRADGLIVYAGSAKIDAALAAPLTRLGHPFFRRIKVLAKNFQKKACT
jgi:hypothetical protein